MRYCPFTGCNKLVGDGTFCCRQHWAKAPPRVRLAAQLAAGDHDAGRIDLAGLIGRWSEIVNPTEKAKVPA